MKKQEIFDEISTLDLASLEDDSLKNTFELMLNLIEDLQQEALKLKEINQALRDEINQLKGEQGKPTIKPSTKTDSRDISSQGKERENKKHIKQAKKEHIQIHQTIEVLIDKQALVQDAKLKYWDDVITQDIVFEVKNTCYKLAVYYSASLGKTFRAKAPDDASYHSKNLQSFIITLNKVLDVTESKILTLLKSIGVKISTGSISNILLKYTDIAQLEKQEILKAGLASSYVQTDITGARVCGKNKYSNIITNPFFTSYTTTSGKSHLDVLAAFQGLDNKEKLNLRYDALAIEYLKKDKISINDLQQLDLILKTNEVLILGDFTNFIKQKIPDLYHKKNIFIKVKSALALAYYTYQDEIPKVYCLVSDNAPEYNKIALEHQALCWVHDARYYKKLQPVLERHREKLTEFIAQYWEFYNALLNYKKTPNTLLASKISADFDTLFTIKTNYFQLDKLINKTLKNKDKLLIVLVKPEIPLHNNLAELKARAKVRKRDISYHTMSDKGTICLDAFMTITQTAIQLNVDIFQYIKQMINGDQNRETLAELIRAKG
jgi:hypothetical protein